MFRFLVTGACTAVLTAAGFACAGAAQTTLPASVTVATAAADTPAAPARGAGVDYAAPTAGADLAMWGVAPATSTSSSRAHVSGSRLVSRFADGILHRSAALAMTLTRNAMRFLGVPYVFGGTSASGFDCSGYVQHVFAMLGIHLPRTADAQYEVGKRVQHIRPGDLVFFQTYTYGASHVGIYLGQGRFVHSSSSHGVEVSELHDAYWSSRYLGAKRILVASK